MPDIQLLDQVTGLYIVLDIKIDLIPGRLEPLLLLKRQLVSVGWA